MQNGGQPTRVAFKGRSGEKRTYHVPKRIRWAATCGTEWLLSNTQRGDIFQITLTGKRGILHLSISHYFQPIVACTSFAFSYTRGFWPQVTCGPRDLWEGTGKSDRICIHVLHPRRILKKATLEDNEATRLSLSRYILLDVLCGLDGPFIIEMGTILTRADEYKERTFGGVRTSSISQMFRGFSDELLAHFVDKAELRSLAWSCTVSRNEIYRC